MFQRRTRTTEVLFMCFVLVAIGLPGPAQAGSMNSPVSEVEMSAQHDMIKDAIADAQMDIQTDIAAAVKTLMEGLNVGGGAPCGAGTGGQRFVENGSEVCDNTTGLYWVKTPDMIDRDHQTAVSHCAGLNSGYRLPKVKELISLVDYSVASPGPVLPAGHPFSGVMGSPYWSATLKAPSSNLSPAWVVLFNTGEVKSEFTSASRYVWCVRGGL